MLALNTPMCRGYFGSKTKLEETHRPVKGDFAIVKTQKIVSEALELFEEENKLFVFTGEEWEEVK
jgi:hypothetical protein